MIALSRSAILRAADAKQRIDVSGLVIAPGFIDIHSHAGRDLAENPNLESVIRQGITTALDGKMAAVLLCRCVPFSTRLPHRNPIINFGWFVGHGSIRNRSHGDS